MTDVNRLVDQYTKCLTASAQAPKNKSATDGKVSAAAVAGDCTAERAAISSELPPDVVRAILNGFDTQLPKVVDKLANGTN